jgi:hypothetical protein
VAENGKSYTFLWRISRKVERPECRRMEYFKIDDTEIKNYM